jgi:hypothetical protein
LRRQVFNEVDTEIQKLSGEQRAYFASIVPEYLFYSNLGRSDLIKFESWTEKYMEINKKNDLENLI